MAPIQARAEVTRQVIIDAGVELFGSVGYGDTDMIDVINRANTTKGTCYYHFPTKKALAVAIIEQSNHRIASAACSREDRAPSGRPEPSHIDAERISASGATPVGPVPFPVPAMTPATAVP